MVSSLPGSSAGGSAAAVDPNSPVSLVVPTNLKTLIRMIMRAFYGFELYLCMEMLMFYPCIKEEDLAELLRMDLKVVHQHLVNLKKEKFINERSMMTEQDGRQSKHSFFYINYKMMVNVIKYKLDKIRIQIESEEKQCTSRANFKCTNCGKTYSDLDTKDIFLTMTCLYCNAEVEEDVSCLPNRSSRNLLAKFNTQMEIVFELLSRVEHVRLADDILRPEPVDLTHVLERMMNTPNSANAAVANPNANKMGRSAMVKFDAMGMTKWSGDKTRNTDLLGQTRISINFDSSEQKNNVRQKKELPSILLDHATNDDDWDHYNRDSQLLDSIKMAADETLNNSSTNNQSSNNLKPKSDLNGSDSGNAPVANVAANQQSGKQANVVINLEVAIMQKLLIHEKKKTGGYDSADASPAAATDSNSSFCNKSMKRDFDSTADLTKNNRKLAELNGNGYHNGDGDHNNLAFTKKRKLNNGEIVSDTPSKNGHHHNGFHKTTNHSPNNINLYHSKSYSDGSDRDDPEDDESNSYFETEDDNDMCVPRVTVQNRNYRLDKLNPYLINQMNETEKEFYINVCRQLYTEIYEI